MYEAASTQTTLPDNESSERFCWPIRSLLDLIASLDVAKERVRHDQINIEYAREVGNPRRSAVENITRLFTILITPR